MSLRLQGIFPPITTPFDHNGNIYAAKVQHNVEKWNRTSLSGYVVMGSTGESVMLTTEEKISLWELVAQYAAPDKLLIAGTGMESVRETVCLTNRAAEMGYKAAMVRTPHYYKNLVNRGRRADAVLPRGGRPVAHSAHHLQLAAGHRRGHSGGGGGGAFRASQHHRHQGELRQPGKGHADDPRGEARIPGAGGLRAHACGPRC